MRGMLRLITELARRTRVGAYLGDFGAQVRNTETLRFELNNAALVSTGAGVVIARQGGALHCHPHTFAGCKAEVYFGPDQAPGDQLWQPISPGQIACPTNGESFEQVRVRLRPDSNVDAGNYLVLIVDPAPFGAEALEAKPRAPEVDSSGGISTLIRALLRTTGASVALEAVPGNGGRGILEVAPIAGQAGVAGDAGAADATTLRTVTASDSPEVVSLAIVETWDDGAGRADVNLIPGETGIDGGVGDPAATTVRVVGASTPTSSSGQVTAGAASSAAAAANANRKACVLKVAPGGGGAYVRCGPNADATAFLLGAGEAMTISDTRAINVIRESGDVTVYVFEESHA